MFQCIHCLNIRNALPLTMRWTISRIINMCKLQLVADRIAQFFLPNKCLIYGETGRYPMLTRQEQLVLGYWLKIISVPVTNPVRFVYAELLKSSHAGHNTWCTNVAILMRSIGFMDVCESQTVPNDSAQICSLKHNLKIAAVQKYAEWENEVKETGKHPILRTYIKSK